MMNHVTYDTIARLIVWFVFYRGKSMMNEIEILTNIHKSHNDSNECQ